MPARARIVTKRLDDLGKSAKEPSAKWGKGSTNAGNATHVVPSNYPRIVITPDTGWPQGNSAPNSSKRGDEAMIIGAKATALTYADILTPKLMAKVKRAFKSRCGVALDLEQTKT